MINYYLNLYDLIEREKLNIESITIYVFEIVPEVLIKLRDLFKECSNLKTIK